MNDVEKREMRMLVRAQARLRQAKHDPDFLNKLNPLVIADIIAVAERKLLTREEIRILEQNCRQSKRVHNVLNRMLEAIFWSRSREGIRWSLRIKYGNP